MKVTSNTFSNGDCGYIDSSGTVTLADASAESTADGLLVIATEAISGGSSGTFRLRGIMTVSSHGYTVGAPLFVSETAGELTNTAPTTTDSITRIVGYAIDANTLFINVDGTYVEHD